MLLELLMEVYEEDFTKIHLTTFSKSEMSDIFILKKTEIYRNHSYNKNQSW